ncbi:YbjN domain-containing protein [bacterium 210820-DFI.6.38]|nr:YbjN domain-containing protein [bacterium 210820-DFI.6.38]
MKKVIDTIKSFFENNDWKYNFNDKDKVFSAGIDMGNILGNVRMVILLEDNFYNVYMVMNSKVEEKYFPVVAEFLHRANYGLKDGNFEMDYRDGEIRYKSFVNFKNIDVSEEVVGESIIVGAAMIDRYGKGLLKLMLGDGSPEECIKFCESEEKGSISN